MLIGEVVSDEVDVVLLVQTLEHGDQVAGLKLLERDVARAASIHTVEDPDDHGLRVSLLKPGRFQKVQPWVRFEQLWYFFFFRSCFFSFVVTIWRSRLIYRLRLPKNRRAKYRERRIPDFSKY